MKIITTLFIAMVFFAGCSAPNTNERRGTEIGAVTGAIIGGIIGHQSGETGAGAAIGAAVGGTAGAAAGAAKDRKEDQRYEKGVVHAQPMVDSYGYSLDDYIEIMTADELEILQARSQARPEVAMGVLLTDKEKANLRARDRGRQEIGR